MTRRRGFIRWLRSCHLEAYWRLAPRWPWPPARFSGAWACWGWNQQEPRAVVEAAASETRAAAARCEDPWQSAVDQAEAATRLIAAPHRLGCLPPLTAFGRKLSLCSVNPGEPGGSMSVRPDWSAGSSLDEQGSRAVLNRQCSTLNWFWKFREPL